MAAFNCAIILTSGFSIVKYIIAVTILNVKLVSINLGNFIWRKPLTNIKTINNTNGIAFLFLIFFKLNIKIKKIIIIIKIEKLDKIAWPNP